MYFFFQDIIYKTFGFNLIIFSQILSVFTQKSEVLANIVFSN